MDQIELDILSWYNRDKYTRLGNDVSVTELLKPVRITHLLNRYRPKTKLSNINNIIPSLIGSGLHDQLQKYLRMDSLVTNKWQIERHVLGVINGYRVSGRFDALYDNKVLYDIKVTRAWKFEKGDYTEWEQQLNIYDYLLWKDGISLEELKIMGIVLDWQKGKQWKTTYPSQRTQIVSVKKWSRDQQEKFIHSLVREWSSGLTSMDNHLPLCTSTERWADKPVFKLFRTKSSKRATKVFPTKARAGAYLQACQMKDAKKWKEGRIEEVIDNKWNRCENWCEVKDFCNQYKNKIER